MTARLLNPPCTSAAERGYPARSRSLDTRPRARSLARSQRRSCPRGGPVTPVTGAGLAHIHSFAAVSEPPPVSETGGAEGRALSAEPFSTIPIEMKESDLQATNGSRCRSTNRAGLPCRKAAVTVAGFCLSHDPEQRQDMAVLGRLGGSVRPQTKLRQEADDDLRELARSTLEQALRGEQVDPGQLAAAKSLFAFRPAEVPRGAGDAGVRFPDR